MDERGANLRAIRTEQDIEKAIERFTGTRPRASTVHCVMFFFDFGLGLSNSRREFWVSAEIANAFVSRIKSRRGRHVRLLPFLCEVGLIKKVGKHSREAGIACQYRLLLKPMKQAVRIEASERTLRKIKAAREFASKSNDEAANWVRESMALVSVPEETLEALVQDKEKDYSNAVEAIRSKLWQVKTKKRGRITTPLSNVPEEAREQFTIGGEQVTRLDINGSHLHMLSAEIERRAKFFKGEPGAKLMGERGEYRLLLNEGGDAYLALCSDFPSSSRKRTKRNFQIFLNAKNGKFDPGIPKALRKRFPAITAVIVAQNKSAETFGVFLQSLENRVIRASIKALKERGIHCIPIVDEILVPWSRRDEAIEIMSNSIFERCGTRAVISGVRYEP